MGKEQGREPSPEKHKKERLPRRITHTVLETRVGVYIGGGLIVTGKALALLDKAPALRPVEIIVAAFGAGLGAYARYAATESGRKKQGKKKKKKKKSLR